MCGIAGYLGQFDADPRAVLARMMSTLVQRGPDDAGEFVATAGQGCVALGHRRLSIIDLSAAGHQPMVHVPTGNVVVYNGELYNFRELRHELNGLGHSFHTASDTEVLLAAYAQWGRECLSRLRGMFALALWDARAERLLLARDHLGIKPLYLAELPHGTVFASEARAVVASGLVSRDLDAAGLASYLAFGSVQAPLTLRKSIRSLPPGGFVELNAVGAVVQAGRHFVFPQARGGAPVSFANAAAELRTHLETAVQRHLVADVPVAVFLSSGVDSTCIAGLSRRFDAKVQSFTVTFAEHLDHNEGAIAADTARRFGITHTECPVSEATVLGWVSQALAAADLPSLDGLNVYVVSRAAAEHGIRVALSGQGGDEVFGGYPAFRDVPRLWRALKASHFPAGAAGLVAAAARPFMGVSRALKLEDLLRTGAKLPALYFQRRRLCSDSQLRALGVAATPAGLSSLYQPLDIDLEALVHGVAPAAAVSRLELAFYMHNTLLRDGDVFSMANSLEVRVPLLCRSLLDYAMGLNAELLFSPSRPPKALLREACRDLLTPTIAGQAKRGFVVPLKRFMRGPLHETVHAGLASTKASGLVDPAGVDAIAKTFAAEPESPTWSRVWALVTLGHWLMRERATL